MTGGDGEATRKTAPPSGSAEVDAEHGIQLGLLEAASAALSEAADDSKKVLDQLYSYSEAHFLSEQLLMRLNARPEFEGHIAEHETLLRELESIATLLESGDREGAAVALKAHARHLRQHILSWDRSVAQAMA